MPTTYITTDQDTAVVVESFDTVVVVAGVTVTPGSIGINGSIFANTTAIIHGAVYADTAVSLGDGVSNFDRSTLEVGATGIVSSAASDAVFVDADVNTITNHGQITTSGIGLHSGIESRNQIILQNTGLISSNYGLAVYSDGSTTQDLIQIIQNSGTIVGSSWGIGSWNDETIINNSGTITGLNTAIYIGGTDASLRLTNSGTLQSLTGQAIDGTDSVDTVDNLADGRIIGGILLRSGADRVSNAGEVVGDVNMGSGDDLYDGLGMGSVTGWVEGMGGNDTLRGSGADDRLDGGENSDLIAGRSGDDTLTGDTGADTITGGTGNDDINGGVNDDSVNGNAGDDTIRGEGGDDALRGGRDDDLIIGGNGADTLRGDSGDDRIIGDDGRDDMFGGSGRDVFVFEDLNDSGTGGARDRIYDFQSGADTLDISALAGPAFSFLGSSNFTSSGNPEVRAVSVANGTLIYIDANGDGTRDSDIYLIGTASVTEGDFLL